MNHATAASTLFSEAASNGINGEVNSIIAASASTINGLGSSFTNSLLQSIFTTISPMLPTLTQADVDQAFGALSITDQAKQNLITQGIGSPQQNSLALLGAVESSFDGGIILASTGIHRRGLPHLEEATCILYDVGVAALSVSAILTGGLTLGVVAGITITWGMVFGAATVVSGVIFEICKLLSFP
jgi:hypothetical protein